MMTTFNLVPIIIIVGLSLVMLCALLVLNLRKQKADQLSQETTGAHLQEIITSISKNQSDTLTRLQDILTQNQNAHQDLTDAITLNNKAVQANHQDSNEISKALYSKLDSSLKETAAKTSEIIEKHSQVVGARLDALKDEVAKLSSTLHEATSL